MKLLCGAIVLACAPLALARNDAAYPTEKIAAFVVERLDVTTFPSSIRPKLENGKKTFGNYGYLTRKVDEKEALLESPHGGSQITISILEARKTGLYVCVNGHAQNKSVAISSECSL